MTARALPFALGLLAAACIAQEPKPTPTPPIATEAALRERAAGAENSGRFALAADCYLQLVGTDPGRAQWVLDAGRCLGLSGRFNDAIELLTKKRAVFPGLLEIPALLARTHLLHVERDPGILNPGLSYADAVDLATEVLRLDPDHEDARLILAQARYAQGDSEAALAAANEAVRRHPQRAGAHILVGRIAYDQFVTLKRAIDTTDVDKDALLGAMDAAQKQAVVSFRRAAELDRDRSFARVMLGQIAAVAHDDPATLQEWSLALAIDPTARVDHGWIRSKTEPPATHEFYRLARERFLAREHADRARAATLTFYMGLARYEQAEWQAARELFAESHAQDETFSNADYYAAICAWRLGDQDGAEALAAGYAAASATGFADVLRNLGPADRSEVADIVRRLGDRAYANDRKDHSRDLNHVIACLLDSADAWNNYAFLCRETSRFDDAFAGYQHALEKEPDSPQLWNDAAVILQYHLQSPENVGKARAMYDHAIELADRTLADRASTELARDRARKARDDAKLNLAELGK